MSRMSAALARPHMLERISDLSCMVVAVHAPGSGASLHGLQWACIASAAQLSHAGVPPSRGCLSMAACADMVRDAQLARCSSPSIHTCTYDICVTQTGRRSAARSMRRAAATGKAAFDRRSSAPPKPAPYPSNTSWLAAAGSARTRLAGGQTLSHQREAHAQLLLLLLLLLLLRLLLLWLPQKHSQEQASSYNTASNAIRHRRSYS